MNSLPSAFTEGFDNWKHASPEIRRYEETVVHNQAMVSILIRKNQGQRVDHELVKQVESEKNIGKHC